MRNHPFAFAPLLIVVTLLLGMAFGQIKFKTNPPAPQPVTVSEVLQ